MNCTNCKNPVSDNAEQFEWCVGKCFNAKIIICSNCQS